MKQFSYLIVGDEVKKLVNTQINIVDNSETQEKRLKEYTVGVEVKKFVTLPLNIVSQSRIQVRRLLSITVSKNGKNVFIL